MAVRKTARKTKSAKRRDGIATVQKSAATSGKLAMLIAAMRGGGMPGQWASDHYEEAQHFVDFTYVAVHKLAQQFMQAQRIVEYATTDPESGSDGWAPAPQTHRLARLLERPNGEHGAGMFLYRVAQQLALTGQACIWGVPNALGLPVELFVIPISLLEPLAPTAEMPRGGWRVQMMDSCGMGDAGLGLPSWLSDQVIPYEQLRRIMWPHPLLLADGMSPVSAGARMVDAAEQANAAAWSHLRNGADPSLVVQMPDSYSPDEAEMDATAEKVRSKYSGVQNVGKVLVLPPGAEASSVTQSPREMAYGEVLLLYRDAILAIHGTPGVAAGITDASAYAAFYAALLQYSSLTVQPALCLVAEELTAWLSVYYGDDVRIRLLAKRIDDPQLLEQRLRTDIAARAIRKNELRALRDLPPDPEGDEWCGDAAAVPIGDVPLDGMDGNGSTGTPEESDAEGTGMPSVPRMASKSSANGHANGHASRIADWVGYG